MRRQWYIEFARLGLWIGANTALGFAGGEPVWGLAAGSSSYILWQFYQLHRLDFWIRRGKKSSPPSGFGIWNAIYQGVAELVQRNRKRKRKLTRFLKRFQESTAAIPDAIVVISPEDRIEWLNTAAYRILGLRAPQDVGTEIGELIDDPKILECLKSLETTEPLELTSPVDRDMKIVLRIVRYAKDQRMLIARDVSRLKRLESVRRDFVANVSHELRTPLTVILGYLETLRDKENECPPAWMRSLTTMHEQARRMERLVADLLLLARLETARPDGDRGEPVPVPSILATVLEEAVLVSAGDHRISGDIDPDLWLEGHAEELRSAFANLIQNAVRYTPAGGDIRVRWHRERSALRLEVRDTGIGIPANHLSRLTERFYRVDVGRSRQTGGTGLGLAIVKHVLTRHDATLNVESTEGAGSTFHCDFPLDRAVNAAGEDEAVERWDETRLPEPPTDLPAPAAQRG